MIDNHLGRRRVSYFQRGVLALRMKEIISAPLAQADADEPPAESAETIPFSYSGKALRPRLSLEAMSRAVRVSSATLGQIEKIKKTAALELLDAVKAGVILINSAAAVASLPSEQQVAAVVGGRKELRQAAWQLREAKAPPKQFLVAVAPPAYHATPDQLEIHRLTVLLNEITEERDPLKKKVQHLTIALAVARGRE